MTEPILDLIAFDLTGTTVKDNGAMEAALSGALTRNGVPFHQADLRAMRGGGKKAAFQLLVERRGRAGQAAEDTSKAVVRLYADFKELLRKGYSEGPVEEVPGSRRAILSLKERGIKVAATTALDVDVREIVLARLGWDQGLFDGAVSTDEVPRGRPAPYMVFRAMMECGVSDVRRVAVVGDTPLDLQSGANAGAGWIVGVLCGVYGVAELGATYHTHLLGSPADLPALLG